MKYKLTDKDGYTRKGMLNETLMESRYFGLQQSTLTRMLNKRTGGFLRQNWLEKAQYSELLHELDKFDRIYYIQFGILPSFNYTL